VAVKDQNRLLAERYKVIRSLGSGGMATVFLAEDMRLGRRVAVKRLHAHSPEDMALRFTREARLGASMNHPNLVSVFDTVTDDEGVLIVMEYVEGQNLAEAIRRDGRIEPERALAILHGAAAGLDEAHARGVVHRDVKPANILLGDGDVAKIADLGIGKAAEGTRITREGAMLGTPSYMAPELLEGGTAGPPADVYGLAAVAYETLGGRKAVSGKTPVEIAHKVASNPVPDLREAWPDAPQEAADVLKRGMARDPGERPASAGKLIEQLQAALAPVLGGAAAGAAAPPPTETTKAIRREPTPQRTGTPAPVAPRRTSGGAPPPPGRATYGGSPRRRFPAWIPVAALLAAVAVLAVILAAGGDDNEPAGGSGQAQREQQQDQPSGGQAEQDQQPQEEAPAEEEQPADEQPAEEPSASGTDFAAGGPEDAAQGAQLNNEGFAQMNGGDVKGAVKTLRKAVKAFPAGSDPAQDIQYAYALFNLGRALNRSGKPDEAIPYLEARAKNPDQSETVQAELARAREAAGQ
jgi:eukaryotic-like serine/threonine-protein kinase